MPRKHTIRQRRLFLEHYQGGQVVHGRFVKMFVMRQVSDEFRFGITTTRKIGNAVVRNRCRRLIREVIRHSITRLQTGVSVIFVVKKAMVKRSYFEIEADLHKAFQKAELINDNPSH